MHSQKLKLGFLASHGGSNMQAVIDNVKKGVLNAELCLVISNNSESGAIAKAKAAGVPCMHISDETHIDPELAIIEQMQSSGVEILVLAGYMKYLSKRIIAAFNGKILNIHPSLLPKYGGKGMYGMNVHKAVLKAGEKFSGATIHLVDIEYDHGRILMQSKVAVKEGDTPETLAERVLQSEHKLYTECLKAISEGTIVI